MAKGMLAMAGKGLVHVLGSALFLLGVLLLPRQRVSRARLGIDQPRSDDAVQGNVAMVMPFERTIWTPFLLIRRLEMSQRVLQEKLDHVRETGAEILATGNPGCQMQIGAGAKLAGMTLRVCHPVELLDESYRRAGFYGGS